jgi:hypothetical protein
MTRRVMKREKDYTCVATKQLAAAFHRHRDPAVPLPRVAEKVVRRVREDGSVERGIDVRDLKKIVEVPDSVTNGIGLADRVLLAIGCNLQHLADTGELTVIPSPDRDAPRRMAEDEWWVARDPGRPRPGPQERLRRDRQIERRTRELTDLRKATLAKFGRDAPV